MADMTSARRPRRRQVVGPVIGLVLLASSGGGPGPHAPLVSARPSPAGAGVSRVALDRGVAAWEARSPEARGGRSRLIGTVDAVTRAGYVTEADLAARRADATWPPSPGERIEPLTLTVLAPATDEEFLALTGLSGDGARQRIAAVTDGPVGPTGRALADRIVLNPSAMDRLSPAGRAFVLRHEAAHVALRARLGGLQPRWLTEGYADWVAYADPARAPGADIVSLPGAGIASPPDAGIASAPGSAQPPDALLDTPLDAPLDQGLTVHQVAVDALAAVRSTGPPQHLPTSAEFDEATSMAAAYQRSWLLVDLLVDRYGDARVRAFLAAATVPDGEGARAAADAAADAAFVRVLGTSRTEVTRAWVDRLVALARS